MKNGRTVRKMIDQGRLLVSMGAFDVLSAKIIEAAGLPSVYVTGYGAAAAILGAPDLGLLASSEMIDQVRRIAAAVECPVIADADTGYGGPANVWRTVREYEAAGVEVIQLEDQEWPKKCGHLEGKRLVPPEEMLRRLRVAVQARRSPDFLIIARTDAVAVEGFTAAMERAQAYREAGADILFVEAPRTVQQMKDIPRLLQAPCLANMVEGGQTPFKSVSELAELGYAVALYPISALLAAAAAVRRTAEALKQQGSTAALAREMISFSEFNEIIGLDRYLALEKI
ncbi:MAG: oxaloacetate decarboxylase [Thermodesulfobacteriota bacterium]